MKLSKKSSCGVFILLFIVMALVYFVGTKKNNVLYVWPLWGIGNRLRTLRVCFAISKYMKKEMVIIEHEDEGFKGSISKIFGLPFKTVSLKYFLTVISPLQNVPVVNYTEQCANRLSYDILSKHKNTSVCFKGCEIRFDSDNLNFVNDRSLYSYIHFTPPTVSIDKVLHEIRTKSAIGVHIRQGNVNDWERGFFFNDEWRGISKKEPESAPLMCCFEDKSKNLSACTSNVTYLERYIKKMKTFPNDTTFFICSDRPGCMLYLHQLFPNRIISNSLAIETKLIDTMRGVYDFYCLSQCTKIIATDVSTFCDEARRIGNIPVESIQRKG